MRVPNLVPIGPQAAMCIRPEGYTHTHTDRYTQADRLLGLMQITQLNVGIITEIPFDFSQKYQTVPRPNRRATVYFGTQELISVGCRPYTSKKNLNVGPANRPDFCRQVPLFYAKCPSKNILQEKPSVPIDAYSALSISCHFLAAVETEVELLLIDACYDYENLCWPGNVTTHEYPMFNECTADNRRLV